MKASPGKPFVLQNQYYRIEIEPRHGIIRRIRDLVGKSELITEPRLAENFRLLLPLPTVHANYLLGTGQALTSFEHLSNGIRLHWAGPLRNAEGKFKLAVTLWVELVGEAIQFRCRVENRTKHKLAEVWYPILGGMTGLGNARERSNTRVLVPYGYSQWTRDLFSRFGAGQCLGVAGGEHAFNYPYSMSMPWASLYNPSLKRAVYFGAHDRSPRFKSLSFTMVPGNACQRVGNDWPTAQEARGLPVGVTASWTFMPCTEPGSAFEGPPVILQCHEGNWRRAASLYRNWFDLSFGVVDSRRDWLRRETATLDTMFMLPEDNINLTYRDIPSWARSAQRRGVNAVMLSGWQVGGHDRGYPFYQPEPRLGTWKELQAAIRACHAMGVRVYFFVNIHPMDLTTGWFRKELHRYAVQDPWGHDYGRWGWGMGTLSARQGWTRTPVVFTDPSIPRVREIFVTQMKKLAQAGADGVHIDKITFWALNFNPRTPASPDRSVPEGVLRCVDEMLKECRAVNPEFAFSYEGWFDRLMTYSDVTWWAPPEHSVMKVAFPEWVPHVGVEQPYSYNLVNLAVIRGHNLLVGPANYQASMDHPPMRALNDYIGEITRIRRELLDVLSRGELLDASDAFFASEKRTVKIQGPFARDRNTQWTVFRDTRTKRRALVLANLGRQPIEARGVSFVDAPKQTCRIFQPFKATRTTRSPVTLTIPSERVVVIVE